MKKVLDKGYVRLVDVMGSDLSVVNSARVSYNKATSALRPEDEKLIQVLATHDHTSPFRHATMQFEIQAYANAVKDLAEEHFPVSLKALTK